MMAFDNDVKKTGFFLAFAQLSVIYSHKNYVHVNRINHAHVMCCLHILLYHSNVPISMDCHILASLIDPTCKKFSLTNATSARRILSKMATLLNRTFHMVVARALRLHWPMVVRPMPTFSLVVMAFGPRCAINCTMKVVSSRHRPIEKSVKDATIPAVR
jgi:hypothetical protein